MGLTEAIKEMFENQIFVLKSKGRFIVFSLQHILLLNQVLFQIYLTVIRKTKACFNVDNFNRTDTLFVIENIPLKETRLF